MSFSDDLRACVMFWSRLPVRSSGTAPQFSTMVRALPVAALVIALPAALTLTIGRGFGFSPVVAALLAVCVGVAVTGALHEDGLADCADAWAGATPERSLEIMKDSRIGAFGALALIFSVGLRAASLAAIAEVSTGAACACLFAAAALSRVAGLLPLSLLPPARATGMGHAAGAPDRIAYQTALAISLICAALPLLEGLDAGRTVLAAIVAFAAAFTVVPLARKKFGGQTGDVAGAAQQLAEIACLLTLSTGVAA